MQKEDGVFFGDECGRHGSFRVVMTGTSIGLCANCCASMTCIACCDNACEMDADDDVVREKNKMYGPVDPTCSCMASDVASRRDS